VAVRVNDADYRAICRRVLAPEREARLLASTPEDEFAHARAYRVERDQRLTLRPQVGVERLDDQQLPPFQRIILHRRHDVTDDARKLHLKPPAFSDQQSAFFHFGLQSLIPSLDFGAGQKLKADG
jgi:hypothetical protein